MVLERKQPDESSTRRDDFSTQSQRGDSGSSAGPSGTKTDHKWFHLDRVLICGSRQSHQDACGELPNEGTRDDAGPSGTKTDRYRFHLDRFFMCGKSQSHQDTRDKRPQDRVPFYQRLLTSCYKPEVNEDLPPDHSETDIPSVSDASRQPNNDNIVLTSLLEVIQDKYGPEVLKKMTEYQSEVNKELKQANKPGQDNKLDKIADSITPEEYHQIPEIMSKLEHIKKELKQTNKLELANKLDKIADSITPEEYHQIPEIVFKLEHLNRVLQLCDSIKPPRETLSQITKYYKEELCLTAEQVQERLNTSHFEPTFTAHPTDTLPLSAHKKLSEIADLYLQADSDRQQKEMKQLLTEYCDLDMNPESHGKITAETEIETNIFFMKTAYKSRSIVCMELQEELREAFPDSNITVPPSIIELRTWCGGDQDGKRNSNGETLKYAHQEQAKAKLKYLRATLEQILDDPTLRANDKFMLKYSSILQRLNDTQKQIDAGPSRPGTSKFKRPYQNSQECLGQVEKLLKRLPDNCEPATREKLEMLRMEVKEDGFLFASVDVRQESKIIDHAVETLLKVNGLNKDYEHILEGQSYHQVSEDKKVEILNDLRRRQEAGEVVLHKTREQYQDLQPGQYEDKKVQAEQGLDDSAAWVLGTLRAIDEGRAIYGDRAVKNFIIAMTHEPSHLMEVQFLLNEFVKKSDTNDKGVKIVPLIETIDDMKNCPDILRTVSKDDHYRQYREKQCGNKQLVMLGYSDSAKDGGTFAAQTGTYRIQLELTEQAKEDGFVLEIFHGRGGTTGRGGGSHLSKMIETQPPGTVNRSDDESWCGGYTSATEQNEVPADNYRHSQIGTNHLAQNITAFLTHPERDTKNINASENLALIAEIAQHAVKEHRNITRAVDNESGKTYMDLLNEITPKKVEAYTISARAPQRPKNETHETPVLSLSERAEEQIQGGIRAIGFGNKQITCEQRQLESPLGVYEGIQKLSPADQERAYNLFRNHPDLQRIMREGHQGQAKRELNIAWYSMQKLASKEYQDLASQTLEGIEKLHRNAEELETEVGLDPGSSPKPRLTIEWNLQDDTKLRIRLGKFKSLMDVMLIHALKSRRELEAKANRTAQEEAALNTWTEATRRIGLSMSAANGRHG